MRFSRAFSVESKGIFFMNRFQDLQLPPSLSKALQAMSLLKPTPVQAQSIPPALARQDVIGIAPAETGKTAAYCIPIAVRLSKCPGRSALILVPTHELALKIEKFWKSFTQLSKELTSTLLTSGTAMSQQVTNLRLAPRLIVATPDQLVEHLSRGTISVSKTEILVLNEADRMLELGFAPQLTQILRFVPKVRQTLLFSATWPKSIDLLASKYMKDPARVILSQESEPLAKTKPATSAAPARLLKKSATKLNKSSASIKPALLAKSSLPQFRSGLTERG